MPVFEQWDRQSTETSRAYALFAHYRDAGPLERSYPKVARDFGRKVSTIVTIAQRYNWVARAALWDAENERIKRAATIKELEGMARRQVLAGQLFMSKGLKKIQSLTDDDIALMSTWEAIRLVEVGTRLERLGRGETDAFDQSHIVANVLISAGADTPIVELLRRNPTRVGPFIETLVAMESIMPELSDSAPVYYDGESEEIDELTTPDEDDLADVEETDA